MNAQKNHLYFAYGSNMDQADLDNWCDKKGQPRIIPSKKQVAKLTGYKLCFNYYSKSRQGGAANIMVSDQDCVWGLLMEITDEEREIIRLKEGYPDCYNEIRVDVETRDGVVYKNVLTYQVVKDKQEKTDQPPTEEYLHLIIKNALDYQFPPEYIAELKKVRIKKNKE